MLKSATEYHKFCAIADVTFFGVWILWDQSQPRPLCPVFLSRDQQLCGFNRITGLVWPKSKECIYFDVPGYKAQISHKWSQNMAFTVLGSTWPLVPIEPRHQSLRPAYGWGLSARKKVSDSKSAVTFRHFFL